MQRNGRAGSPGERRGPAGRQGFGEAASPCWGPALRGRLGFLPGVSLTRASLRKHQRPHSREKGTLLQRNNTSKSFLEAIRKLPGITTFCVKGSKTDPRKQWGYSPVIGAGCRWGDGELGGWGREATRVQGSPEEQGSGLDAVLPESPPHSPSPQQE